MRGAYKMMEEYVHVDRCEEPCLSSLALGLLFIRRPLRRLDLLPRRLVVRKICLLSSHALRSPDSEAKAGSDDGALGRQRRPLLDVIGISLEDKGEDTRYIGGVSCLPTPAVSSLANSSDVMPHQCRCKCGFS